jgi:glycosyltransferase involved in cell wall biosynthesis
MKRIWIIAYYISPPEFVSNPRHLEFAHNLMGEGYDVTIFCSGFLRENGLDLVPAGKYKEVRYGEYKFCHIKVRHYQGNGLDRMISIFQFAWRLLRISHKFDKPDIIIHNIHAPFDYPIAWCAKRFKAKYIVEAWDLWPDSFVRFGLISAKNPAIKLAYGIERKLYEKADKIIFTFEGGIDYLKERRWTKELGGKIDLKKIHYINNGVNISQFNHNKELYQQKDEDLLDTTHFKIIYLGSISQVNNINLLIDAAKILIENSKYQFLIYGDGSDRFRLERYCKEKNIHNVVFKDKWIPLSSVPFILSKSSLNILNYQNNFGVYGISSGKLFQYLASGKPICCNIEIKYCLITKYNLGISRQFNNSQDYANAILELGEMDNDSYLKMCERVNEAAKQFDYRVLFNKLKQVIKDL